MLLVVLIQLNFKLKSLLMKSSQGSTKWINQSTRVKIELTLNLHNRKTGNIMLTISRPDSTMDLISFQLTPPEAKEGPNNQVNKRNLLILRSKKQAMSLTSTLVTRISNHSKDHHSLRLTITLLEVISLISLGNPKLINQAQEVASLLLTFSQILISDNLSHKSNLSHSNLPSLNNNNSNQQED
jgi:hypothetical protein